MSLELRAGLLVAKNATTTRKNSTHKRRGKKKPTDTTSLRPTFDLLARRKRRRSWRLRTGGCKGSLQRRTRRSSSLWLPALRHCDGERAGRRRDGRNGRVHGFFGGVEIRRLHPSATLSCPRLPRRSRDRRSQQIAPGSSAARQKSASYLSPRFFVDIKLLLAYYMSWVILPTDSVAPASLLAFLLWWHRLQPVCFPRHANAAARSSDRVSGNEFTLSLGYPPVLPSFGANLSHLESTFTELPLTIHSKRVTRKLNSLESTFMKKRGEG